MKKTKILITITSFILYGCFFPQAVNQRVEDELEINFYEVPRSLVFYEDEQGDLKTIYYAIEISQNQFKKIVDSWQKIQDPKKLSIEYAWNEIGINQLQEWKPQIEFNSSYSKKLNNGNIVIAQYADNWMFIIRKERK